MQLLSYSKRLPSRSPYALILLFLAFMFIAQNQESAYGASLLGHVEVSAPANHRHHKQFNPQWQRVLDHERSRPFFNYEGRGFSDWDAQTWRNLLNYARKKSDIEILRLVNGYFNHIPHKTDPAAWSKREHWASPREFMGIRGGDCEDYAIAKYFALRFLGFDSRQMRVIVVLNHLSPSKTELHAVLAVFCNKTWFILDNNASPKDAIFPHLQYGSRLTPLYSVNENGSWIYMRGKTATQAP